MLARMDAFPKLMKTVFWYFHCFQKCRQFFSSRVFYLLVSMWKLAQILETENWKCFHNITMPMKRGYLNFGCGILWNEINHFFSNHISSFCVCSHWVLIRDLCVWVYGIYNLDILYAAHLISNDLTSQLKGCYLLVNSKEKLISCF